MDFFTKNAFRFPVKNKTGFPETLTMSNSGWDGNEGGEPLVITKVNIPPDIAESVKQITGRPLPVFISLNGDSGEMVELMYNTDLSDTPENKRSLKEQIFQFIIPNESEFELILEAESVEGVSLPLAIKTTPVQDIANLIYNIGSVHEDELFMSEVKNRDKEDFIRENHDSLGKHIIEKYLPNENMILKQYFEYLEVPSKEEQSKIILGEIYTLARRLLAPKQI